ncbi:MAG: hypothetical protein ACO331_14725 [Prochlorothrix sp.]
MNTPFFSFPPRPTPHLGKTAVRTLGVMAGLVGTTLAAQALTPSDLPISIRGLSGGSETTQNCGSIDSTPHAEIQLSRATYLKLNVTGGSDPTLYIEGPLNLCVLSDKTSAESLQTSGRWPAGNYRVYVGEKTSGRHNMTLDVQGSGN